MQINKNEEILWVLQKGITICSLGLHNQDKVQKEKGKSQLLNHLFFTSFCSTHSKHKIVEKIPFVSIRVYEDLFPLNVIDVPHDCPE